MADYFVLGLNHTTAPVELRERLHFGESELEKAIKQILRLTSIEEVMILSTCNRVEFIGVSPHLDKTADILTHFLWKVKSVSPKELESHLYFFRRYEAIRHVFRVAASLDSMVIGEPQILGQLKNAIKAAENAKTFGKELMNLGARALRVAKKVRTQTDISAHAVSISFVAVELAKRIFGDLSRCSLLLVGTGKMSTLALRHFVKQAPDGKLFVTNRTRENANEIASEFGGTVLHFSDFKEFINHVDIIITSTASKDYIVTRRDLEPIMMERKNKPLFIIDIAVPRDIDPEIKNLKNAFVYDIDDLRGVVQQNLQFRQQEAQKGEEIVNDEVERYRRELHLTTVKPVIIALRNWFEQVRLEELKHHTADLEKLGGEHRELVEHITQSIVKRILHTPLCSLKSDLSDTKPSSSLEMVEKLFGLEPYLAPYCADDDEDITG